MSWETLDGWVSLACLSFTFFHLYNECGISAKVAAIIPFPVLTILCNIMAFQKLEVSCFTSSSGLALWLNLADRLVETCADSEPRPKETLHASALCHGILTSQHVKKPRLTCWRMRDQVAQVSAWPQPTQKLSCAADGSSPQTHDGAQLTLEEPPNWVQSKCQPIELRAEGRFGVLLSHWLLEYLLHIQSFKCKWYSMPHRVARRVWKAPSTEPGAPKSYDWFQSLLLPP